MLKHCVAYTLPDRDAVLRRVGSHVTQTPQQSPRSCRVRLTHAWTQGRAVAWTGHHWGTIRWHFGARNDTTDVGVSLSLTPARDAKGRLKREPKSMFGKAYR